MAFNFFEYFFFFLERELEILHLAEMYENSSCSSLTFLTFEILLPEMSFFMERVASPEQQILARSFLADDSISLITGLTSVFSVFLCLFNHRLRRGDTFCRGG